MSIPKKTIFPENKFTMQTLTPTYNKIKCPPFNEGCQNNEYFMKSIQGQNSFLRNFKNKHLNSATPHSNYSKTEINDNQIKPFKMNDPWDTQFEAITSDRNISKIMGENINIKTNDCSSEMIESLEEKSLFQSSKSVNLQNYSICNLAKVDSKSNLENKKENKENDNTKKNNERNKLKLNFRKKSEDAKNSKIHGEEFSASKNLLHSSVKEFTNKYL